MYRQTGYSLTETLISVLFAMLLVGMAATAFSGLNRSFRQTQQLAELQQNAQFIMTLFQNELANTSFWGGVSVPHKAAQHTLPIAPEPDCQDAAFNSGSFPAGIEFVSLYSLVALDGRQLGCIPQASTGNEILQVKRLLGLQTQLKEMRANRFYLETSWQHARFVDISSSDVKDDFTYYPYQHLVFYIQEQRLDKLVLPVLMRKRLVRNKAGLASISTDSILDGVEKLHFEFGIDTDMDGQVNAILPTAGMPDEYWLQQNSRIVSVHYYVLLRSRQPDPHYQNFHRYQMGHYQFDSAGDHYRRLLISSTVHFANAII